MTTRFRERLNYPPPYGRSSGCDEVECGSHPAVPPHHTSNFHHGFDATFSLLQDDDDPALGWGMAPPDLEIAPSVPALEIAPSEPALSPSLETNIQKSCLSLVLAKKNELHK